MRPTLILIGCLPLLLAGAPLTAPGPDRADAPQTDPRVEAATTWLEHLDRGEFEESWESASPQTRSVFPRAAWISTLREARRGLEAPEEREVVEATEVATAPGAPDGEYARVTFRSRFASRTLDESVTLVRSEEETWRVFGYRAR